MGRNDKTEYLDVMTTLEEYINSICFSGWLKYANLVDAGALGSLELVDGELGEILTMAASVSWPW